MTARRNARFGATSSAGAQVAAGLVGVVFLLACWVIVLISAFSGLLWGMPPKYGGLGWEGTGVRIGVALVASALGVSTLFGLHRSMRAMRVHRPALVLLTGGPLSLASCAGVVLLLPSRPGVTTPPEVEAMSWLFLLLIGFGVFAALARVLPARSSVGG